MHERLSLISLIILTRVTLPLFPSYTTRSSSVWTVKREAFKINDDHDDKDDLTFLLCIEFPVSRFVFDSTVMC